MNILILCTNPELESIHKLTKYACDNGHCYEVLSVKDTKLETYNFKHIDVVINRVSGISYDDSDLDFLTSISHQIPVINKPCAQRVFRDKYEQFLFYKKNNIPTIETRCLEHIDLEELTEFLTCLNTQKFLIKPLRSNQARGIITCADMNEATKTYQRLKEKGDLRYVIQPFIKKSCEWRILIINSQHICTMKKEDTEQSTGLSILNCHNSKLEMVPLEDLPLGVWKIAQELEKKSKLHIMACDILTNENAQHQVIEVNCVPGMKYVEEVCQINTSEQIINSLKNLISAT